jgi:hypothetical protein
VLPSNNFGASFMEDVLIISEKDENSNSLDSNGSYIDIHDL